MALIKYEYPDLDIDVEVEILCSLFKLFPHRKPTYFGQLVVSTGDLETGIVKGLMTPTYSFKKRRNVNEAIRRTMKTLRYKQGRFQRRKVNRVVTNSVAL